ncbi:hypothetical protein N7509_002726 [Penicillium cosmopolitanum]|uniref:DUF7719 domain-containing protein n=1 Tax=Penicillium cosmopolitanum TaxID=1131564 RepID=A0A9W9W9J8_9EURO|nr:uncharacterized protein N7509_002726 [Penicillium cosmopolitanum]KAJ5408843.1 hypothetical protein N7509_002726 [Penicillium cosmopolitanum]
MDAPRNRKQRRAAAATSSLSSTSPVHEIDIPLAHPPRDNPPQKASERTLYDIIAERQNELQAKADKANKARGMPGIPLGQELPPMGKGTRFVTVDASGNIVETDGNIDNDELVDEDSQKHKAGGKVQSSIKDDVDDEDSDVDNPLPPFIDTVLLSMPLTTLHGTLSYLAAYQYAESTDAIQIIKDSIMFTFPLLTFLVHLVHGHIFSFRLRSTSNLLAESAQPISLIPITRDKLTVSFLRRLIFPPSIRTLVFLPISIMLGVHLITVTNGEPYYAVMKKAPAYGTVWIWFILELSFGPAVLGALGPLIWGVWWKGYGIV